MHARTSVPLRPWQKITLTALLPSLVFGGSPNSIISNPGVLRRPPQQRAPVIQPSYKPVPGRHPSAIIMDEGRRVDQLKKIIDEWGTVSMAPLLFAPVDPEVYDQDSATPTPAPPFALKETDPSGDFTLKSLYDEYNKANGRSLFAQRTQTKVLAEGSVKTDAIAQAIQESQMAVFRENLSRTMEKDTATLATAEDNVKKAQDAYDKAELLARGTDESVDRARGQVTAAEIDVLQAEGAVANAKTRSDAADTAEMDAGEKAGDAQEAYDLVKDTPGEARDKAKADLDAANAKHEETVAAKNLANGALLSAEQDKRNKNAAKVQADARLAAAKDRESQATGAVTTAKENLTNAQSALETAKNAQLTFPASNLPSTTTTPALATPSTEFTQINNLSGAGNLGSLGSGTNLMPELLGDDAGVFSPMARINSAASALTVKNILSFLGNPEAAATFDDKRILFGVTTLSVNPGWRSKRDHKAVIDAQVTITREKAHDETIRQMLNCPDYPISLRAAIAHTLPRALTEEQREFFKGKADMPKAEIQEYARRCNPAGSAFVHAVSPMVDSQNLDLASSIARQDEIALHLAATLAKAGFGGAGNFFSSWSRLRRKDVATRSTVATANSFSMGDHFGFEMGTRLRGLDEDEAKGNKAAQILDRQTFPVLLIVGMSEDDARPTLEIIDKGGDDYLIRILEPRLQISYSTRWSRTHHNMFTWLRAKRKPSHGYEEVLTNGRVLDKADDEEATALPIYGNSYHEAILSTDDNISREYDALIKSLHGATYMESLPASWMLNYKSAPLFDPDLTVTNLSHQPQKLTFADTTKPLTLVFTGEGLQAVDPAGITVIGSGVAIEGNGGITRSNKALSLQVRATPGATSGQVRFLLPYLSKKGALTSDPISFSVTDLGIPTIGPWGQNHRDFPETFSPTAGGWTRQVFLTLGGTDLDKLPKTGKLGGIGLGADTAPGNNDVTVKSAGPTSASVSFTLNSPQGRGELFLHFNVPTEGGGAKAIYSPPLSFAFPDADPRIDPFTPEQAVLRFVDAKVVNNKVVADLSVLVSGVGLQQVANTATLGGAFTGAATVAATPKALVAQVHIDNPANQPLEGPLFLTFTNGRTQLVTSPLPLKLVLPPPPPPTLTPFTEAEMAQRLIGAKVESNKHLASFTLVVKGTGLQQMALAPTVGGSFTGTANVLVATPESLVVQVNIDNPADKPKEGFLHLTFTAGTAQFVTKPLQLKLVVPAS